ncbi:MAG: UDP-N-acetyl glucosamine 2-epimerase [Gemmatimonadota bacterium]
MTRHDIALCYGTRPQVIKASVLRTTLASVGTVLAVDTGQHYDHALNALLYEQLGARPPDLFLEVGSGGHAEQTAAILIRAEAALLENQPRVVVVIGDTNSTLGCALAAAKLRIPVVHVEAGLRAADSLMAEEINRRAVDGFATVLCTPSGAATRRMRTEHPGSRVVESGDVAYDVLRSQADHLGLPPTAELKSGEYVFATLHRAELVGDPRLLREAAAALALLGMPVVLAAHPRTLALLAAEGLPSSGSLRVIPAVGYLESLAFTRHAALVATDSGGVQREAYWLGTPCLTLRNETEWVETVELGANRLVSPARVANDLPIAATAQMTRWKGNAGWDRTAYGSGAAARSVAAAVRELLASLS